uniref:Uncharacterized protein n=1 Tax=Anguilla anguilla TaxID=7936 RepID=A0A0E9UKS9_ANGAN
MTQHTHATLAPFSYALLFSL